MEEQSEKNKNCNGKIKNSQNNSNIDKKEILLFN